MKYFCIILFIIINLHINAIGNDLKGITTLLVVLEEQENDEFVIDDTPFTDGIFNALWEKSCIFFDVRLNTPINIVSDNLEVKSYLGTAQDSGADGILLIKFHYYTIKEGHGIRLKANEIMYNIYSLNTMKTIRSGKYQLTINKYVDSSPEKSAFLKNTGYDMLTKIYK